MRVSDKHPCRLCGKLCWGTICRSCTMKNKTTWKNWKVK